MPGVAKSSPKVMKCLLEKMAERSGFVLVRDGKENKGQGQFDIDPAFYTRVYRLKIDEEFVNTWIRFKYDARTGDADLSITWKDLEEWERLTEEGLCGISESGLSSAVESSS